MLAPLTSYPRLFNAIGVPAMTLFFGRNMSLAHYIQSCIQSWSEILDLGETDKTDASSEESIAAAGVLRPSDRVERVALRAMKPLLLGEAKYSAPSWHSSYVSAEGAHYQPSFLLPFAICHYHSSPAADQYGQIKARGNGNPPVIVAV